MVKPDQVREKRKKLEDALAITFRKLVFMDFKRLFIPNPEINLDETFVKIVIQGGLSTKLDNSPL